MDVHEDDRFWKKEVGKLQTPRKWEVERRRREQGRTARGWEAGPSKVGTFRNGLRSVPLDPPTSSLLPWHFPLPWSLEFPHFDFCIQAIRLPLLAVLLAAAGGCATPRYETRVPRTRPPHLEARIIRPVVAATEFENQASFAGQWKLGGGMADLLVTELIDTDRVIVLERKNLDDMLGELMRQGKDLFRREGRAEYGRLKNARYVLRGVITDFTVSGDASGWFGTSRARGWLGGSSARVSLNVKIADVESGEVLDSVRADGTARSGFFGAAVDYKNLSFGGDAFFQTPLGRATEAAIREAVASVLDSLPVEYWTPRIADVVDGMIVLNGGANVGLVAGTEFTVREPPRIVTDPLTGDPIDEIPGRVTGKIRVTDIRPASAYAVPVTGTDFRRAAVLQVADP